MRKLLILLLFALGACETDLDLRPKVQVSEEEAFSNRANVEAALTGCYDALQLQHYYGRNLIIVGDLASDNSFANGTKVEYYDVDKNSLLANNIIVEGIWADVYVAINRVNHMLYKLRDVEFLTPEELKDIKGQLHFLRALHYFNLVRLYGGVPLKLLPTLDDTYENFLKRSSTEEVYQQIIADLEVAAQNIDNSSPEKATVKAATAMLSSVELTRKNYQAAFQSANLTLQAGASLSEDYSTLFSAKTDPDAEIIFYIPFSATDKNRLAEYNFPNTLGGRHENAPDAVLVSTDTADQRNKINSAFHNGKYYSRKYSDLTTGADRVIVLRNAELLLIRAEAAYHIDSVSHRQLILNDINQIRMRAGLLPVLSGEAHALLSLIDKEKQKEFAFEGKRWFDLIRTGKAVQAVATVTEPWQMLFPVPLSEISSNPNIGIEDQNEGY